MAKLTVDKSSRFRRELKKMTAAGKDEAKLNDIVEKLANREVLEPKYRDHNLRGKWEGCRECHIEHDWLLMYKIIKDRLVLYLVSTGTHDDL